MLTLIRSLGVACFALLLSVGVAYAVDVDLRNSNGTKTPLKSNENGAASVSLYDLIGGEHVDALESLGYLRVSGAFARPTIAVTAVTTNATSAAFTLPAGAKTPLAKVEGTGALTQTFTVYGAYDTTAANGISLCVITLSATTKDVKTCDSGAQITKDFPYYYIISTSTTGTGASGEVTFYNGLVASGTSSGGGDATAAKQDTQITALQLIDNLAVDPCSSNAKTYKTISIATGTELFVGTAATRTYVCQLTVLSATTQNIALVSGTGVVCATATAAMLGGTTAATGFNFAANGGIVIGDGGHTVAKSTVDANNICILMSSTGQLSGVLSYVVAAN